MKVNLKHVLLLGVLFSLVCLEARGRSFDLNAVYPRRDPKYYPEGSMESHPWLAYDQQLPEGLRAYWDSQGYTMRNLCFGVSDWFGLYLLRGDAKLLEWMSRFLYLEPHCYPRHRIIGSHSQRGEDLGFSSLSFMSLHGSFHAYYQHEAKGKKWPFRHLEFKEPFTKSSTESLYQPVHYCVSFMQYGRKWWELVDGRRKAGVEDYWVPFFDPEKRNLSLYHSLLNKVEPAGKTSSPDAAFGLAADPVTGKSEQVEAVKNILLNGKALKYEGETEVTYPWFKNMGYPQYMLSLDGIMLLRREWVRRFLYPHNWRYFWHLRHEPELNPLSHVGWTGTGFDLRKTTVHANMNFVGTGGCATYVRTKHLGSQEAAYSALFEDLAMIPISEERFRKEFKVVEKDAPGEFCVMRENYLHEKSGFPETRMDFVRANSWVSVRSLLAEDSEKLLSNCKYIDKYITGAPPPNRPDVDWPKHAETFRKWGLDLKEPQSETIKEVMRAYDWNPEKLEGKETIHERRGLGAALEKALAEDLPMGAMTAAVRSWTGLRDGVTFEVLVLSDEKGRDLAYVKLRCEASREQAARRIFEIIDNDKRLRFAGFNNVSFPRKEGFDLCVVKFLRKSRSLRVWEGYEWKDFQTMHNEEHGYYFAKDNVMVDVQGMVRDFDAFKLARRIRDEIEKAGR